VKRRSFLEEVVVVSVHFGEVANQEKEAREIYKGPLHVLKGFRALPGEAYS